MAKRLYWLFAVLFICGCVVSPLRNGVTNGPGAAGGKLYVSTSGSILRFGSALTANASVSPEVIISGSSSQLNAPQRLFVDTSTDRLFVANKGGGSVLIFSPASKAIAGSAPSAVLTSSGNMFAPVDVTIDPGANLLYVADGKNILVFSGQSTLSGSQNTPPVRTITVAFTIGAIFLDAANNNLIIADTTDDVVDILPSASSQSGDVTLLLGAISGTPTNLHAPNGMALDSNRRLIVSNFGSGGSILIFPSAVIPGGGLNAAPVATISGGSTKVASPGQMAFHGGANNGELYVADSQAPGILIFTGINQASGTITLSPTRSIIGSGTQLNAGAVNGVALDTTR